MNGTLATEADWKRMVGFGLRPAAVKNIATLRRWMQSATVEWHLQTRPKSKRDQCRNRTCGYISKISAISGYGTHLFKNTAISGLGVTLGSGSAGSTTIIGSGEGVCERCGDRGSLDFEESSVVAGRSEKRP